MLLNKDNWNKNDIKELQEYLKSFENSSKKEWSKSLLKTDLPILCLTTQKMKEIINEISKGNYLSFLDLMIWEYYENTAINGFLINKITDFSTKRKYLDIYSSKADNWATCDLLTFDIESREVEYYNLALEYIKSDKPFVRRIGVSILFNFVDNSNYINKIFSILNYFYNEKNYYVNMICAWLLCECFIKQRKETLIYLKNNSSNKFIINKGIQKCRESRRVSKEDKNMLIKYKK